jgi:hypothetical protein
MKGENTNTASDENQSPQAKGNMHSKLTIFLFVLPPFQQGQRYNQHSIDMSLCCVTCLDTQWIFDCQVV